MAKLTTFLALNDRVSRGFSKVGDRLKKVRQDQERVKQSTKSMRSEVATLAAQYRKTGMSASEAMKRAWTETERVKRGLGGFRGLNPFGAIGRGATKFFSSVTRQVFNLRNLLLGLGVQQLFKFTIGGAAEIEQLQQFLSLQLGSEAAATMDFINQRARDSIFSFEELSKAASSFSTILKDTNEIQEFTKFAERLSFLDPAQGFEGASLALKELLSGETRSLRQRFELPISQGLEDAIKAQDLDLIMSELDQLIPITEDMLDALSQTGSGAFKRLSSNIATSFKEAGNQALQFLKPTLDQLNETFATGGFDQFFADFSLGLAVAVGFLLDFVNLVGQGFRFFADNADIIIPLAFGIATAIGAYVLATQGAAIATAVLTGAVKLLSIVMSLNPIGLVIALIVGLITALVSLIAFNDDVRASFAKVFGFIVDAIEFAANIFIKWINLNITSLNAVKDFYFSIWQGIFNFVLDKVDGIIAALNKIPGVDLDISTDKLRDNLTSAVDFIKDADIPTTEFTADFSAFKEAGQAAINSFDGKKFLSNIKEGLQEKFEVPQVDAGQVETKKFNTELFGAENQEGFTLNEFIIDEFGNILDSAGRDSFVAPIEDNRTFSIKIADTISVTNEADEDRLVDKVIRAVEDVLSEEADTESSLVPQNT